MKVYLVYSSSLGHPYRFCGHIFSTREKAEEWIKSKICDHRAWCAPSFNTNYKIKETLVDK